MRQRTLPVGISVLSCFALGAGIYLNLYLSIIAGVLGLTTAAWLTTEETR